MKILDVGCGVGYLDGGSEAEYRWIDHDTPEKVREALRYTGMLYIDGVDGFVGDKCGFATPGDFTNLERKVNFQGFSLEEIPAGPYDAITWLNPDPWELSGRYSSPFEINPLSTMESCIVERLNEGGFVFFESDMFDDPGVGGEIVGVVRSALKGVNSLFDRYLAKIAPFKTNDLWTKTGGVYRKNRFV